MLGSEVILIGCTGNKMKVKKWSGNNLSNKEDCDAHPETNMHVGMI